MTAHTTTPVIDADYSAGERFERRYHPVGNRQALTGTAGISQTVHANTYDAAIV